MKNVLIIGQAPDPHIESVLRILRDRNANIIFYNIYDYEKYSFILDPCDLIHCGRIRLNDHQIVLTEIDSIWWRLKPFAQYSRSVKGRAALWSEFIMREWRSTIDSLEYLAQNAKWINPRKSDNLAKNKPVQLSIAKEIGFNIPYTKITNDSGEIIDFIRDSKRDIVYKVLTWYFEYPDRMIFTSKINLDLIQKNIDLVRMCPGIFQERVDKAYEIRITTVGKEIFSARIDSQTNKDTMLDWRRNQFEIPYSKHRLPKDISKMILCMNERLGIVYAAYDFIVTPEGEYYFLEVNPSGQWLWLEHKLDFPISNALANVLLS